MDPWAGVAVLLALLLVVQTVAWAYERRQLLNRVIARHAPDLVAIERRRPHKPKPPQEPAKVPTKLSEGID